MILTVLFYTSLVVMVLGTFLGLHCLGKVTQERDEALWGQQMLIEQNKRLYEANQLFAMQHRRWIQSFPGRVPERLSGNVFPTEGK